MTAHPVAVGTGRMFASVASRGKSSAAEDIGTSVKRMFHRSIRECRATGSDPAAG